MKQSFALIGAGWRGDFFLRIARDLPERFPLAGVVVRDAAKRAQFQEYTKRAVFEGGSAFEHPGGGHGRLMLPTDQYFPAQASAHCCKLANPAKQPSIQRAAFL